MPNSLDPDDHDDSGKRRRISKACDQCRKRKVKCDGQFPCKNCSVAKNQCGYTHIEKKRVPPRRVSNIKNIQNLESRLDKVETLLERLVNHLTDAPAEARPSPQSYTSDDDMDDDDDDESLDMGKDEPAEEMKVPNSELYLEHYPTKEDMHSTETGPLGQHRKDVHGRDVEQFFGLQSSFSIFSPRGLVWVAKKLGNDSKHLIDPLKDLHLYVHQASMNQLKNWVEPITADMRTDLPEEHITMALVSYHLTARSSSFLEKNEVSELFRTYFALKRHPKDPHKRQSYSELLLMNALVALSTALKTDICPDDCRVHILDHNSPCTPSMSSKQSSPASEKESITHDQLVALQQSSVINCIYYYHRVCVLGGGVTAVQGILVMYMFLEMTFWAHANYMLVSTAIRLAQELGLDRRESFYGLNEQEADKRRRIWWYCYVCDRDVCLKSGKPPIINDRDVSTLLPKSFRLFLDNRPKANEQVNQAVFQMALKRGFCIYTTFYQTQMAKITSKAYDTLFGANSLVGKSPDQIVNNISSLNKDLEEFASFIDEPIRPGNEINIEPYKQIREKDGKDLRYFQVLALHLTYHFHVMTINRVAFKIPSLDVKKNDRSEFLASGYASICMNAARKLLELTAKISKRYMSIYSAMIFYPFSAFIIVFWSVIENPMTEYAPNDLNLLIYTGLNFFKNPRPSSNDLEPKLDTIEVVVKQMLRIVTNIFETKTQKKVSYPDLAAYLNNDDSYLRFKNSLSHGPQTNSTINNINTNPNVRYANQVSSQNMGQYPTDARSYSSQSYSPMFPPQMPVSGSTPMSQGSPSTQFNNQMSFMNRSEYQLGDELYQAGMAVQEPNFFYDQMFSLPNFLLDGGDDGMNGL